MVNTARSDLERFRNEWWVHSKNPARNPVSSVLVYNKKTLIVMQATNERQVQILMLTKKDAKFLKPLLDEWLGAKS